MNETVAQSPDLHLAVGGIEPAEPFCPIRIVEGRARRLAKSRECRGQQPVAEEILQASETGCEGIEPFGEFGQVREPGEVFGAEIFRPQTFRRPAQMLRLPTPHAREEAKAG